MAGPLVAAGAAGETASAVSDVLTGDLVVIRGEVFRTIRRRVPTGELTPKGRPQMVTQEVLVPVEVEAHINPVTIGLAAAGIGAGILGLALASWWSGIGVKLDPQVQVRLDEVAALLHHADRRIIELESQLIFVYGSLSQVPPDDPLAVELASIKAQIVQLRRERSGLRRGLLRLESRGRFGQNVFRIF